MSYQKIFSLPKENSMAKNSSKSTPLVDSISENHGLSLLSDQDLHIYSVGISTAGLAEIRMAKKLPNRKIIATTIDLEGANYARKRIAKEQLSEKIEVKIEDVSEPLPYKNESFDFIYARLILHYLSKKELENALKELYRVLKKNGKFFVVVRSKDCVEAQNSPFDPITCMTTYISENGQSQSRYFHDQNSICNFLSQTGFSIIHIKSYDEQLSLDFQRKKPSKQMQKLIEVYTSKALN